MPSGIAPFAPILFLYLLPYLSIISPSSLLLRPSSRKIRPSSGTISVPNRILPPMTILIASQFHPYHGTISQMNHPP